MCRSQTTSEKRSVVRERLSTPTLHDDSVTELAQSIVVRGANPARRAVLHEMEAGTRRDVKKLKRHGRAILVLRYLEQLGVEAIAGVLGMSQTAVTARRLRTLQPLGRLLGDEFGAE